MKSIRLLAVVAVLAIFGVACGSDSPDANGATSNSTTSTALTSTNSDKDPGKDDADADEGLEEPSLSLSAYWLDENNEIRVGYTQAVPAGSPGADIAKALLAGPLGEDVELGLHTSLPSDARLRSLDVVGSEIIADFSKEFTVGSDPIEAQARLAQVVYTLTQFPTVQSIEILIEGEPEATMGASGVVIKAVLSRADFEFGGDYETFAPTVLIESPRPGQQSAGNGVEVSGSAFTFEAAVYLEALAATGEVMAPETYFMADRIDENMKGTFSVWLDFESDLLGDITLRAFDISAESGEAVGVTEVPIIRVG